MPWKIKTLILISISLFCQADEVLDVETLPVLRTKQYSMGPYKKIVVFSAPRTGSSLLYNIFRFLFENPEGLSHAHNEFHRDCSVLKTHRYQDVNSLKEESVLYIVPIRNPINASISNYRIHPRRVKNKEAFCKQLIQTQVTHLQFSEKLKETQPVIFIKHEDFEGNLDYLIDFIENHFLTLISPLDKEVMRKGYAKENIFSCIRFLSDFNEYLPISGFHGNHVLLEKYTPPPEVLDWLHYHLQKVKPVFEKYGYLFE